MIFTLKVLCDDTIELREIVNLLMKGRLEPHWCGNIGKPGSYLDYTFGKGETVYDDTRITVDNVDIYKMEKNHEAVLRGVEQAKSIGQRSFHKNLGKLLGD